MADDNKKLSASFAEVTAANTVALLRDIRDYNQKLRKHVKADNSLLAVAATLGEAVTAHCIKIVENQQRQNT